MRHVNWARVMAKPRGLCASERRVIRWAGDRNNSMADRTRPHRDPRERLRICVSASRAPRASSMPPPYKGAAHVASIFVLRRQLCERCEHVTVAAPRQLASEAASSPACESMLVQVVGSVAVGRFRAVADSWKRFCGHRSIGRRGRFHSFVVEFRGGRSARAIGEPAPRALKMRPCSADIVTRV